MPRPSAIARRAGIGLRAPHYQDILDGRPDVAWLEAHSENYFGEGGRPLHILERLRARYPVSLHGVGLSPGTAGTLDAAHLDRLARLVARIEPVFVSEHLSWGAWPGGHLNALLPLPLTEESLAVMVGHVDQIQDRLGRRILVENIAAYLRFAHATLEEPLFLAELVAATGCGLLLDVNNLYVNAQNHGFDPLAYLAAFPLEAVEEIHLAGHDRLDTLLIDTHGQAISAPVWALFREVVARRGPLPTLIERDADIPPLGALLSEAACADAILEGRHDPPG